MVIIKPLKVLVCLAIILTFASDPAGWGYSSSDVSGGIQGDALSADPAVQPSRQYRSPAKPVVRSESTQPAVHRSVRTQTVQAPPGYSSPYAVAPPPLNYPPQPQSCPPGPQGFGLFQQGVPFGPTSCGIPPYLPRIGCKQFQVDAKLWYARFNSNTVIFGTDLAGGPGTELDLNRDLGLRNNQYIAEYEGRCQIRPNWGIEFSFMPIQFRDNSTPQNGFFFGNAFFPAFVPLLTQWDRFIYRWDVIYSWFQAPHAVSSIFAGYSLYDDKLTVSDTIQSRSRSKGFGLAYAGLSIERVIRDFCGGTASCNCKASVQFLDGYFGWDGYAAGRLAVPMQGGRFGYLEAGWRWIVLERKYPTDADKTSLDGAIATVGLVF
jgi:hypothetical protein